MKNIINNREQVDWRIGADWFESVLVDYDVCANWGNWVRKNWIFKSVHEI